MVTHYVLIDAEEHVLGVTTSLISAQIAAAQLRLAGTACTVLKEVHIGDYVDYYAIA